MVKNRRLARAISECGFGMLRAMVEAKAKQYVDREAIIISRWEPTSQVCSCCGYRWGKLDLSIREVQCLNCGTVHNRDDNAASNIDKAGVGQTHGRNKPAMNGHKSSSASNPTASLSYRKEMVQLALPL